MDYAKMLLAVEVRKLAIAMHAQARNEFIKSGPKDYDEIPNWDVKNAVTSFVQPALKQIELTAFHMDNPNAWTSGHEQLTSFVVG